MPSWVSLHLPNHWHLVLEVIQHMQMDVRLVLLPCTGLQLPYSAWFYSSLGALHSIYNLVRFVLYLVTYAGLVAFEVIISATVKIVCFIWTPITTTVSVGCRYAIVFVSGYRDFLRRLLDFASPIVRDHYSALSPLSDVCEPCDMPSASHCSYRKCLHGHAECFHCSYHGIAESPWMCRNVLRPNTNERPMPWRFWMVS